MLNCVQESKEEAADHVTAHTSAAEATELLEPTATKAERPREDAVRKAGALVALPARIASKTEHLGDGAVRKAGALLVLPLGCPDTPCLQDESSVFVRSAWAYLDSIRLMLPYRPAHQAPGATPINSMILLKAENKHSIHDYLYALKAPLSCGCARSDGPGHAYIHEA